MMSRKSQNKTDGRLCALQQEVIRHIKAATPTADEMRPEMNKTGPPKVQKYCIGTCQYTNSTNTGAYQYIKRKSLKHPKNSNCNHKHYPAF